MASYEDERENWRKLMAVLASINHKLGRIANAVNPKSATALTMKVSGGTQMATFTINTTDGLATVDFTDADADDVTGPNDSVTGNPIAPVVVSDTTSVLTAAASVAGTNPGEWDSALTPVAVGTANLSVSPLVNSDGSPALDSAGQAFTLPSPIAVTVTGGGATGLTLSVSG